MKTLFHRFLRTMTFKEANRQVRRFEGATRNFEKIQSEVLLRKIRHASKSEFGRKHRFDQIKSIADFRRLVPLHTYEEAAPYLEKVKQGGVTSLFPPSEKIKMFALSSGTTDVPKAIPVTRAFLKEFKRGSLLWGIHCALAHEKFLDGKILPIVSPACEEETPGGIPCGAISGLIAQSQKYLARSLYPVPKETYEISDVEVRDYVMLRFTLVEKVTLVTAANPSSLIRLARAADVHRESLIRDIRNGTLTPPKNGAAPWPAAWRRRLTPRPDVARRLEAISASGRSFYPRSFWPDLVLVACWKGGTLSSYLPHVRELYGEVPIRDLGLLASEGRMTIPISDEGCGGVLDLQSHFFEFLPEGEEFHPRALTLLGHELKVGEKYFILLTTSSGLYRYHIHDLVEVEGFYNQTPVLRFLNKGKYFSSLTGEKISEYQVVQAAQRSAAEQNLNLERFLLAPQWDEPPHYILLLEEDITVSESQWERLAAGMEQHLQKINSEYQSKRKSQRLGPLQIQFLASGTFKSWDKKELAKRKGRFEQFKPRFLSNDLSFLKDFAINISSKV